VGKGATAPKAAPIDVSEIILHSLREVEREDAYNTSTTQVSLLGGWGWEEGGGASPTQTPSPSLRLDVSLPLGYGW